MIDPNYSTDVVGVYTSDYRQLFTEAFQISATVGEEAQVMKQPREDGTEVVDHRIILPVQIRMIVMLSPTNYRNVYQQIKTEFNRGTIFSIKTRSTIHLNMVLSAMPREEDATNVDLIRMALAFEESLFFGAQFEQLPPRSVSNKRNSSTTKRGQQNSNNESSSTLYRIIWD